VGGGGGEGISDPWHIQTCRKRGWLPWSLDIDATCNFDHVMYTALCVCNLSSAQYIPLESYFPNVTLIKFYYKYTVYDMTADIKLGHSVKVASCCRNVR
jgi:hypothetical protein